MVLTMRNGHVVEMRGSKYGNKKTQYRGDWYDSEREARYAMILDSDVANGRIKGWTRQYRIPIFHNGIDICTYVADFRVERLDGTIEFIDVKGVRTDMFKLKKKLVRAFYGFPITEVAAKDL